MGKAWHEVSASFDRFCLAAGVDALGAMMEKDAEEACGARQPHTRGALTTTTGEPFSMRVAVPLRPLAPRGSVMIWLRNVNGKKPVGRTVLPIHRLQSCLEIFSHVRAGEAAG